MFRVLATAIPSCREALPRLRGYILVVLAVVALDWATKLLAGLYLSDTITNSEPAQMPVLGIVAFAGVFLVWVMPRPLTVIGCGLAVGGAAGNLIDRALFGPVRDFIPDPFRDGWYANVADVCICLGSAGVLVAYVLYLRENRRLSRALRAAA